MKKPIRYHGATGLCGIEDCHKGGYCGNADDSFNVVESNQKAKVSIINSLFNRKGSEADFVNKANEIREIAHHSIDPVNRHMFDMKSAGKGNPVNILKPEIIEARLINTDKPSIKEKEKKQAQSILSEVYLRRQLEKMIN